MGGRIFIAINLPENIKKKLLAFRRNWPDIPAQWTKEYNLHITLVFLGYTRDEDISEIISKTKEAAKGVSHFDITINRICYGPVGKNPPKMIWAVSKNSKELAELKNKLENKLFSGINQNMEKYIADIKKEARPFSGHITLARLKQTQLSRLELEEIPEINEEINMNFNVNSIEIMESELKKGGPNYTILESIELK
jgi:2'-5' RNA ligase